MQLEWMIATPTDSDGEKYTVHYLVDMLSDQCMAMVPEPRSGHILFRTDIQVSGYDRSFITLEAAKRHCECSAIEHVMEDRKAMAKQFDTSETEAVKAKVEA